VFFDSGGTPVGGDELRRVLRMEEEVGGEGSRTKMKGFAWRQRSPGRWSRRRHSSLILAALMRYRRPASDETQGSSSVEVSECSDVDKRAQSVGTAHGARGDSFMAEAVLREKGGGPRCRGGKERGVRWRGRDAWRGGSGRLA
jgi:hypothetical protein